VLRFTLQNCIRNLNRIKGFFKSRKLVLFPWQQDSEVLLTTLPCVYNRSLKPTVTRVTHYAGKTKPSPRFFSLERIRVLSPLHFPESEMVFMLKFYML